MAQIYKLVQEQRISRPRDKVFTFFCDPRNLDKITPAWLHFRIVDAPESVYRGCLLHYHLRIRGLPITWVSQIVEWDPPNRFVDVQVIGPYKLFHHIHEFLSIETGTLIRDLVYYALPLGWLGRLAHTLFVRRDLQKIFAYRYQKLEELLETR
ncbi:hypothetical protein HRbin36_00250 [bacterium HR36]|nr:hypothetical protein HRbin36_00250 [bacterium HR36]